MRYLIFQSIAKWVVLTFDLWTLLVSIKNWKSSCNWKIIDVNDIILIIFSSFLNNVQIGQFQTLVLIKHVSKCKIFYIIIAHIHYSQWYFKSKEDATNEKLLLVNSYMDIMLEKGYLAIGIEVLWRGNLTIVAKVALNIWVEKTQVY